MTNEFLHVFKYPDYRRWVGARFFVNTAKQMQSLVVAWQVYQLSKDPLALGFLGLAEALPYLAFALWAGHLVDRHERKFILISSQIGLFVCGAVLFAMTILGKPHLWVIYLVVGVGGIFTSFETASASAYVLAIFPKEVFPKAAAWNLTFFTATMMLGPVAGGWIVDQANTGTAYGAVVFLFIVGFFMVLNLNKLHPKKDLGEEEASGWKRIVTGIQFIRTREIILAVMSLDLFAVIFGGAVAMFPIYADLLHVGPTGLGWLKAAPALGALVAALAQAYRPFFSPSWKTLLTAVVFFGLFTIAFAVSTSFLLSLLFLFATGVADGVSVITRSSIVQAHTPDHLRGRVSAVGGIFIRSSNEIGAFESGVAAKLMGVIPSVVFGGVMSLVSVIFMKWKFPRLSEEIQK